MEAIRPRVIHEYRQQAPKKAPCPHCGSLGRRKQKLYRTIRGVAYQSILLVHIVTAEYRARCSCGRTFRTQIPGIEPKAKYTNAVREAVLDRLLEDHMSLERIQAALRRDFFLELSAGFVYDCLHWKLQQLDHADYRAWTLAEFSGTLSIDEIHLGRYTLLLATDPLGDFPVAFAFVDQVHKLFERAQTLQQARQRYHDLLAQPDYAANPDLARALAMLTPEKFEKMIAFLRSPVGQRLRTNNHVERTNRQLRHYEKVRYHWRRARTIVGFVVLAMHRSWHRPRQRPRLWQPPPNTPAPRSTHPAKHPLQCPPIQVGEPRRAAG